MPKLKSDALTLADHSEDPAHVIRAPAVARAAKILRLLANEHESLGVNEIARRVDLVPSTCLHILRALVDEGFIAMDPDKKTYRTSVGLLTLVRTAMANNIYSRVAQPVLDQLAVENNVTAVAVEVDTRESVVVVGLARSDSLISLHVDIGSKYPSYIGAMGRCLAAASGLPRNKLKARFDGLNWDRPPKFDEWFEDVLRVRADGVAIDRGNYTQGVLSMGTLITYTPGRASRGLIMLALESRMTDKTLRGLKQALGAASKNLAAQL